MSWLVHLRLRLWHEFAHSILNATTNASRTSRLLHCLLRLFMLLERSAEILKGRIGIFPLSRSGPVLLGLLLLLFEVLPVVPLLGIALAQFVGTTQSKDRYKEQLNLHAVVGVSPAVGPVNK
jgi:uncharacterized membrane protein YesL